MELELDLNSPVPMYRQIRDQVVAAIASGRLEPGTKVLPVRKLALALAINPATVQHAYDMLREEGFLTTEGRSGSVVSLPAGPVDDWHARLSALVAEGLARGLTADEVHREVDLCTRELTAGGAR